MPSSFFIEEFSAALSNVPGAKERLQIQGLLEQATKYKISESVVKEVSDVINHIPYSLEHSLDHATIKNPIMWIEWEEKHRGGDLEALKGAKKPERIGILLSEYPEHENVVIGVVAWKWDNANIDHASALMTWDQHHLQDLANNAREYFGRGLRESWARMLSTINTFIPEGFKEEIEFLHDAEVHQPVAEIFEAERRNVSAEAIFVFAILAFMNTNAAKIEPVEDEKIQQTAFVVKNSGYHKKWWHKKKGFVRHDKAPFLSWRPFN